MEEEADCKLNLDNIYQERKLSEERYKNTEWEIKARKLVNYCNPYQLCQQWKQWRGKDAFCINSHKCDSWETNSYPMCQNLVKKLPPS